MFPEKLSSVPTDEGRKQAVYNILVEHGILDVTAA